MDFNVKKYVLILGPMYWFLIALFYAGPYWSKFGINVLEFASISDVIKMAVVPVVISIGGFIFAIIIVNTISSRNVGRFKLPSLYFGYSLFVSVYLIIGRSGAFFLLALVAAYSIYRGNVTVRGFREDPQTPSLVAAIFVFIIPCVSSFHGAMNAKLLAVGAEYAYIIDGDSELRYLGLLGDHHLFLSAQQTVIIRRTDSTSSMELHFHPRLFDKKTPLQNLISGAYQPVEMIDDEERRAEDGG